MIGFELDAKTEVDKAFRKRVQGPVSSFTLYSPDIYKNTQIREEQVFNGFGCDGDNISPKLVWKNAPVGTKSFAITMYDPDAKTGSGWWHWIVYNIPANITSLEDDASEDKKLLPRGAIQGLNDYGVKGYGGVCPPAGSRHDYIITLYALDVKELNLPKNVMPAMVGYYLNKYKISTATIHAFYDRGKNVPTNGHETVDKSNGNVVYKVGEITSKKGYYLNDGSSQRSNTTFEIGKRKSQNQINTNKHYNLNSNSTKSKTKLRNIIIEEN